MVVIISTNNEIQMTPPKQILQSASVFSKDFLLKQGLKALLVEENYLFYDEGRSLMRAFKAMGATDFKWCKTDDLLNEATNVEIHSCACNYDTFVRDYLKFEDGIQYCDRLIYLTSAPVYVAHTAFAHLIYAGPDAFINAIDVNEKPTVIEGWLHVVGSYYPDPDLNKAYRFKR